MRADTARTVNELAVDWLACWLAGDGAAVCWLPLFGWRAIEQLEISIQWMMAPLQQVCLDLLKYLMRRHDLLAREPPALSRRPVSSVGCQNDVRNDCASMIIVRSLTTFDSASRGLARGHEN